MGLASRQQPANGSASRAHLLWPAERFSQRETVPAIPLQTRTGSTWEGAGESTLLEMRRSASSNQGTVDRPRSRCVVVDPLSCPDHPSNFEQMRATSIGSAPARYTQKSLSTSTAPRDRLTAPPLLGALSRLRWLSTPALDSLTHSLTLSLLSTQKRQKTDREPRDRSFRLWGFARAENVQFGFG